MFSISNVNGIVQSLEMGVARDDRRTNHLSCLQYYRIGQTEDLSFHPHGLSGVAHPLRNIEYWRISVVLADEKWRGPSLKSQFSILYLADSSAMTIIGVTPLPSSTYLRSRSPLRDPRKYSIHA